MRLDDYLYEGRTIKLSQEGTFKTLETKCSKWLKKLKQKSVPMIYRGIKSGAFFGIVDPSSGDERVSANSSNHMTILIDNLPSWSKYPKRSRSIICSTDLTTASDYGTPHVVIPTDKANMGICISSDIWDSFPHGLGDVMVNLFGSHLQTYGVPDNSWSALRQEMRKLFEVFMWEHYRMEMKHYTKKYPEASKSDISAIEQISSEKAINHFAQVSGLFIPAFKSYGDASFKKGKPLDIIKWLDDWLSPKKNKFKLNDLKPQNKNREVWVGDAPSIVIGLKTYKKHEQEILDLV